MMSEDDYYDDFQGSIFMLTDIERYIVDPVFLQQTGLEDYQAYDAYDITVADDHHRFRLVLSIDLNHLVQKRKIRAGTRVKLDTVRTQFDETTVNGPGIPVVDALTVIDQENEAAISDLNRLPWYSKYDEKEASYPLASGRGYYMDLWSNADVTKTADGFQVQVSGNLEDVSSNDLYSLQEVATRWQAIRAHKPHLLVRVMRRSKLFHYARPNKTDKWPFQLHVVVGDETGCCVVVFWNVMATRYLKFLQEGRVVLLRNFTVKPRFHIGEVSVWHPPGLPWYNVDINVNAHNPLGEVTLMDEASEADLHDVHLPLPTANFVSRKQLGSVPDNFVCDVAGVVTFVGAIQREKGKGKGSNGGFWTKQWLHLQDHSHDLPVVVQLYKGAQKEFEDDIATGLFIVCRNMRIVHGLNDLKSSRQPRHIYVTSTRDTQIYIHETDEDVDYPFASDAVLRSILQYASTADCRVTLKGRLCQILFSFPPEPTAFDTFTARHCHLELTPSGGWKAFVEHLSYRETTQIAVQARLLAVNFCRGQASSRKSKRIQESQNQAASTSDETDDDMTSLGYSPVTGQPESAVIITEEESFFLLQWQGLNTDIVLNTFKPCHFHGCPSDLTLNAMLSGAFDVKPGERTVNMSEDVANRIVGSVTHRNTASLSRYLILLDVHCVDGETVVMGVDRAFPLRGHR